MEDIAFNPADPNDLFELVDLLGEGSYGAVYRAQYKDDPSRPPVAVKIIPADEDLTSLKREIAILNKCKSEYVVEFKDCFFVDNELWIVMEFCMGGSVSDILDATERTLTEPQIRAICACAALGLAYLHENHNIHRDLKAGNILLSLDGKAKLADFGVSAQLSSTVSKRKTVIGTPFWMAPEVIQETSYDGKADVWSLGITAIEMAEGAPPHYNVHPMRAIFLIPSKPPPMLSDAKAAASGKPAWSPAFHDFLAACLVKDPAKRLDARGLLAHPFLRPDVARLRADPAAGLAPIRELVQSALEHLARYRESAAPAAAAAASDDAAGTGAGLLAASVGAVDACEAVTLRPISVSASGHAAAARGASPRPSMGQGRGHEQQQQYGNEDDYDHTLVRHSRRGSDDAPAAGGGDPYGTMVRTSVHRREPSSSSSLSSSVAGSMDVSQTGTMVRHHWPASAARRPSGGNLLAGTLAGAATKLRSGAGQAAEEQSCCSRARPASSSHDNPNIQAALLHFEKVSSIGGGGSSSGGGGGGGGGGSLGTATAAGEARVPPQLPLPPTVSAAFPSSYHDKKLKDLKSSKVDEVQGLLDALELQYRQDREALEAAYLTQRRHLEEALKQCR